MSGILAAPVKTELGRLGVSCAPVMSIAWPDATRRYCGQLGGVSSATNGHYLARVLRWGTVTRRVSDADGKLQPVEMKVLLDDGDKALSKLATGAYGNSLEGSAVTISLAFTRLDSGIAAAQWPCLFAGLVEQIDFGEGRTVELTLRANDAPLRRSVPKRAFTFGDWPLAASEGDSAPLGTYCPILYGRWDARSAGGGGSLPTWNVDASSGGNNRWLIMAGACAAVLAVYDNGTLVKPSTYTVERLTRNGRLYTLVKKNTGRWTGPVTVDAESLGDSAAGTGTLYENPVDQMCSWLDNWVYGDYASGAWSTTAAPINAAYQAAAALQFTELGIRGSLRLSEARTAMDVMDEWCASFPFAKLFWTFRNGSAELAIRCEDWRVYGYPTDPVFRVWPEDEGQMLTVRRERRDRLDRINVRFLVSARSGGPQRALQVRDLGLSFSEAAEDMTMACGMASLG